MVWAADNNHMIKDDERFEGLGFLVFVHYEAIKEVEEYP
jgi:hypothetical protein